MQKHYLPLLLVFEIITLYLYFPIRHAGFVHDGIGIAAEQLQFINYWDGLRQLFKDCSLHPVFQSVLYFFFQVFGVKSSVWYLFEATIHAFNAYLLHYFFNTYFHKNQIKNGQNIAFLGALLFLISPYQTEVVVWKVTLHYLIVINLTLINMCILLKYSFLQNKKYAIWSAAVFGISILSHELSLCTPLILGTFIVFEKNNWQEKTKQIALFVLPKLAIVGLYFLAIKSFTGKFISHYGAATHLNFSPDVIIPTISKYFIKYATFAAYLTPEVSASYYAFANKPTVISAVIALLLAAIIYAIYLIINKKRNVSLLLFLLSVIGLLPIMNLFFDHEGHITNDRFGYLASAFILMLLAYFVYQLRYGFQYIMMIGFLFYSAKFLRENISDWRENHQIAWNLAHTYPFQPEEKVYVLSCMDSYKGIQTYTTYHDEWDSTLGETIGILKGTAQPKIYHIYMHIMKNYGDCFKHEVLAPNQYKLTFQQYGSWFTRLGKSTDRLFENDNFKIETDEWGMSYTITFKKLEPDARIIYQNSDQWVIVK